MRGRGLMPSCRNASRRTQSRSRPAAATGTAASSSTVISAGTTSSSTTGYTSCASSYQRCYG